MSSRERRLISKSVVIPDDVRPDRRQYLSQVRHALHALVDEVFEDLDRDLDWVPLWENMSVQARRNYESFGWQFGMFVEQEDQQPWQRVMTTALADANRLRERRGREQADDA